MTTSDFVTRLRGWLRRAAQAGLLSAHLAVAPVPQPRPRVTRFGVYYPGKAYAAFRPAMHAALETLPGKQHGACVMLLDHVVERPKTGKLDHPRGDVDNYAKATMDAINRAGRLFADDEQVVGLLAFKRYAEPGGRPGIRLDCYFLPDAPD